MAIVIKSDTYKIQIGRKLGIGMMIVSGISLVVLIAANIYWMTSYDPNVIGPIVSGKGLVADGAHMAAYVKYKALFSIIANTLVTALYMGVIWWSTVKRRLGLGFGIFWMMVFIGNGIAVPFYSAQTDALAIVAGLLSILSGLIVMVWFAQLVAYRQRLRQEVARRRRR